MRIPLPAGVRVAGFAAPLTALALLAADHAAAQSSGFTDVTAAAGVTFVYAPSISAPGAVASGGGTEGDFDDDGWPDLFVVGGDLSHDRLFMNNADGTFTDESASAGLATPYRGYGASAADYDKDGDLDLFVTSHGNVPGTPTNGPHKLWRNNGDLTFTDVAASAGVSTTGVASDGYGVVWGDYDKDGDLDLYVTGWAVTENTNKLFRNNVVGTGTADFTNVTSSLNLFTGTVRSYGGVIADMDDDGWPEILVSGDFNTTRYYKGNGDGTFTDVWPIVAGDTKVWNGMGTCIGDWNRDGLMDWFVTAIYPSLQGAGPNGNRLYVNQGGGQYQSLPDSAGVNDGGWGWGCAPIDFDQDGWLDLVMTNGWPVCDFVTLECFNNEPSYLFRNNGDDTFSEVHAAQNLIDLYQGRGLITFDYDRDGDMDIVILSNPVQGMGDDPATGNLKLFRNNICTSLGEPAPGAHYIEVRLDSSANPALAPNGWGANVRVTADGVTQRSIINGGSNYLSRSQLVAHFGLGAATLLDEVLVTWPDGSTTQMLNVPADQLLTIAWAAPTPTWTDLGQAKLGSNGLPSLTASGDLSPSSLNQLDLANAAPSSTATLVFGLTQLSVPFKGGVLVPAPLLLVSLATDATGSLNLPFLLPPGLPADLSLYFQYWISDAGATKGLSASNGLRGVTP